MRDDIPAAGCGICGATARFGERLVHVCNCEVIGEPSPRYGNPNDADLTPEHHLTASEQMGAKLCTLFGLDPSRFSASYLRGAAQAAAGILGKHYAGPGFDAAKWALIRAEHALEVRDPNCVSDLETFLAAQRCCP